MSFILDSAAPGTPGVELKSDTGTSNTDAITSVGLLVLTGLENAAKAQYSIDAGVTWTNSFSAVNGLNSVQVRQTDVAGNVSIAKSFSFTLDNQAAAAPALALAKDSGISAIDGLTNDASLALTGVEERATVQYNAQEASNWTSGFTALIGGNLVKVRQTDVAGNVSASSTTLSFIFDKTAAQAPGVELPLTPE